MKNFNQTIVLYKVLLITLFLLCLLKMPYNYYETTRFLGMVGFVIIGYNAYAKDNTIFMIIWFSSALLINPFFKLALGRGLWNIIDVIWVVLLLISLKKVKQL